jgi:hypothetical protein
VNTLKPAKVTIELTPEQAYAVRDALDLYTRICLGQFEEIAHLARSEVIPQGLPSTTERQALKAQALERLEQLMAIAKGIVGHPPNGSFGIGHRHVHKSGHRAYEIKKALSRELAMFRDPNPEFKGVDYDGLFVRYTDDLAPTVTVKAIEPDAPRAKKRA